MANEIALVTADTVHVMSSDDQFTAPALEAITAGAPIRFDPTAGTFRNGNATDMTEGNVYGLATKTVAANLPVTGINEGILDGFDLSGMSYGDPVYLSDTDARISTVAGTKSIQIGMVVPGEAEVNGAGYKKLLRVNVIQSARTS